MKGRWFFWIPVFAYLLYLVFPKIVIYKEGILEVLFITSMVQAALSLIMFIVLLFHDTYEQNMMTKDLLKYKLWFLLIPYFYIILGINYIFDKYLTIGNER